MGTLIDYAEFLLDIRNNLKQFEGSMLERDFKQAQLHAESALVEARLLCLIAKEKAE
jgi:hypothetical protein